MSTRYNPIATAQFAYQGTYKGHVWDDPQEELRFARSDLEHAYCDLLDVPPSVIQICNAKKAMDAAMDRMMRAVAKILSSAN